jgi:hypothetical protein
LADNAADRRSKALALVLPAIIAIGGWAFSMEGRLQRTMAQQEERGPRIVHIEAMLEELAKEIRDPSASPETRVALDGLRHDVERLDQRMMRLEERINGLHQFLLQSPFKPPFSDKRRGDLFDVAPQQAN